MVNIALVAIGIILFVALLVAALCYFRHILSVFAMSL